MNCSQFYAIALPAIVITTIAGVINTIAQIYDIYWCRWHDCGKSSKNSTASNHQPTILPSQDYPTQSVGSLPADFIPNTKES